MCCSLSCMLDYKTSVGFGRAEIMLLNLVLPRCLFLCPWNGCPKYICKSPDCFRHHSVFLSKRSNHVNLHCLQKGVHKIILYVTFVLYLKINTLKHCYLKWWCSWTTAGWRAIGCWSPASLQETSKEIV